jgi:hypothetical protein
VRPTQVRLTFVWQQRGGSGYEHFKWKFNGVFFGVPYQSGEAKKEVGLDDTSS